MSITASTLKALFPPGDAIEDDDEKFEHLCDALTGEFNQALCMCEKVITDAPPFVGSMFYRRWESFVKRQPILELIASKGVEVRGRIVSNTEEHFRKVAGEGATINFGPNLIRFSGITNKRMSMRSGSTVGKPLAKFKRDEEKIGRIERIKHAHVMSVYEDSESA
jgi:hypothetical protein